MTDPGLIMLTAPLITAVIIGLGALIAYYVSTISENRDNFHKWLKDAKELDFKLYEKEGKYRLFLNGCWVYWMYTNIIWVAHDLDAVEARKDKIKKLYAELKKPVPFWTEVNTKDES